MSLVLGSVVVMWYIVGFSGRSVATVDCYEVGKLERLAACGVMSSDPVLAEKASSSKQQAGGEKEGNDHDHPKEVRTCRLCRRHGMGRVERMEKV